MMDLNCIEQAVLPFDIAGGERTWEMRSNEYFSLLVEKLNGLPLQNVADQPRLKLFGLMLVSILPCCSHSILIWGDPPSIKIRINAPLFGEM